MALGRLSGLVAIGSGLAAAWPRPFTSADLTAQRDALSDEDPDDVLLTITNSRISHVDSVAAACDHKLKLLKVALTALTVEAAIVGVAALLA